MVIWLNTKILKTWLPKLDNMEKLHLSEACIKKVRGNYTESVISKRYIDLYESINLNHA